MKVTLATRLSAGTVGEGAAQWLRFRPAVPRPKKWTPRWTKGLFHLDRFFFSFLMKTLIESVAFSRFQLKVKATHHSVSYVKVIGQIANGNLKVFSGSISIPPEILLLPG